MQTIIASIIVIGLCTIGLGIGVIFFGKIAKRNACGSPPKTKPSSKDKPEDCLNQKAGLCPFEDESGGLKNAKMTQINVNYHRPKGRGFQS